MQKNRAAISRYTGVIANDDQKLRNFYCSPENRKVALHRNLLGDPFSGYTICDYCNCICQELDYYISLDPAVAKVTENR